MKKINSSEYNQSKISPSAIIEGENIVIKEGAVIEDGVEIRAKNIEIGYDTVIQKNSKIVAIKGTMENFVLGDNCFVGYNNQILVPHFEMKDFSQLHNSCLNSGYAPLHIGYNCWIGQNAILNAFEELRIGNNVRMGGCQIWTHVASGELLEGCNFYGSKPVTIEDNVWLMGFGQTVAPGVTLGRNSIIMSGSVVSKSTEPYKTYSGIPAEDITDKLNGWKVLSLEDKFIMLKDFIKEFSEINPQHKDKIITVDELNLDEKNYENDALVFCKRLTSGLHSLKSRQFSVFELFSKSYNKVRTKIEIDWMKFGVGYRARFIPF